MKKDNKMPSVIALVYFSYVIAIFGLVASVWVIIFRIFGPASFLAGLCILITCLFLAMSARILGNIGQILFDLKKLLHEELSNSNKNIADLSTEVRVQNQKLIAQIQSFRTESREDLLNFKSNIEQINCDSKDISQYLHKIQIFFEQIASHLELKK